MAERYKLEDLEYYRNYRTEDGEIGLQSYLLDSVPERILSGFYPTPAVLGELQQRLGEAPNRDPSASDVPPFPPRRRKAELFNAGTCAALDAHVQTLRPEPTEPDADFAGRLFATCRSGLERVRAAFYFVCTASVDDMLEVEGESAVYSLVRKLRVSDGATHAFERLVNLAGVPNKAIYGYKRGMNYESGLEASADGNYWLACYVEGEWRLVDPFWGSQAVTNSDTGNFAKIDDAGNLESAQKAEGTLVYKCSEHFFLTDPELFVLTHFPREDLAQWQLLARPLTLAEFQRVPKYFSGCQDEMHNFSVMPMSHPMNVIVAPPGTIDIYVRETGDESYNYSGEISIHTSSISEKTRAAIKKQADVKGYLSKVSRMGKKDVKFKFVPPCQGKFKLTINVLKIENFPEQNMRTIARIPYVSYVIHCPRADKEARTVPEGSNQLLEFGAGKELAEAGLATDEPGEMEAIDGERLLVLESADHRRHLLGCLLMGATNEWLPSDHLQTWTVGNKTHIVFLSPDAGTYVLLVHETGKPVCQFLLDAPSEFRGADFHLPDFQRLGGLGVADEELGDLISPMSHPNPYVVCEEAGMKLTFDTKIKLEVRAELLYIDASGQEVTHDDCVFVNSSTQGFNVDVRFKLAGHYVLRLYARRQRSEHWNLYANYFIRSLGQLDGSAEPFPDVLDGWSSGNLLVQPRQKLLPLNKSVPFTVQVRDPSVSVVYLQGEGDHSLLYNEDSGLWQGSITGTSESAGSSVKVLAGQNKNTCKELLNYRFESLDDQNIRNETRQRANQLNRARDDSERLRRRKQANHERKERAMEMLPDEPDEEEWQTMKREMEADQRRQKEERMREEEDQRDAKGPCTEADKASSDKSETRVDPPVEEVQEDLEGQKGLHLEDLVDEQVVLINWMNTVLAGDPDCELYLPLSRLDVGEKCDDGVVICKVINVVTPGTIDERVLHRSSRGKNVEAELSPTCRRQNIAMALNAARSLGVVVENDVAFEVASGSRQPVLQLLRQIVDSGLSTTGGGGDAESTSTLSECGADSAEARNRRLLSWVNRHLEAAGCQRRIGNFSQDVRDSEAYAYLLEQLVDSSEESRQGMHPAKEILQQRDPLARAELVLQNAELLNARPFVVQPADIAAGSSSGNAAFVSSLCRMFPDGSPEPPPAAASSSLAGKQREERTYANWMNSLGVEPRVGHSQLYNDLRSGLTFLQLHDRIRPGSVPWQSVHKSFRGARAGFQQLENCNRAVLLGREAGFSLVGICGQDLLDGNETLTLALVWQLMRAHALASLRPATDGAAGEGLKPIAERAIIQWANERLSRAGKSTRIGSFQDASIADARCLLDLIDCLWPGAVDYELVRRGITKSERLHNAKLAISLGWRLGARIYASPEDIVEVKPRMLVTVLACLMRLDPELLGEAAEAAPW